MTETPQPVAAARRRQLHQIRVRVAAVAAALFVAVFSVLWSQTSATTTTTAQRQVVSDDGHVTTVTTRSSGGVTTTTAGASNSGQQSRPVSLTTSES